MLLSIIIPAYNVENYIADCVDSVYKQDLPYSDYEVIVVNDGSTDATLEMLNRLTYKNMKVVTQENQGLSGARNTGISYAKGEYIWFIDSDDTIKPNVLSKLLDKVRSKELDILFFWLEMHRGASSKPNCVQPAKIDCIYSGEEALVAGYYPCSCCSAIFRREYLDNNSLRFYPKLYHQDVEFTFRAIALAGKVMFSDILAYNYIIREGSISQSQSPTKILKNRLDEIVIAKSFSEFRNRFPAESLSYKLITDQINGMMRGLAAMCIRNRKEWKQIEVYDKTIAEMKRTGFLPLKGSRTIKQSLSNLYLNLRIYVGI